MTNTSMPPHPEAGSTAFAMSPSSAPVQPQKNVMGIIALITAIVGFIFACIPGALLVGWILLPISFILAIISLFMKGKKGLGVTALVVSIIGTIVGVMVFIGSLASAVDESFSGGDVSAAQPVANADESAQGAVGADAEESVDQAQGDEGTRVNPYPIGTAITQGDWTVTVNSTTLDATQAISNENPYNEVPVEGNQYLLANVTATYNGDDPQGEMPFFELEYVTVDGNTVNSYDHSVVTPNEIDSYSALYTGASTTGNIAFQVPSATAGEGSFAVKASLFGDKVFVAAQ